MSILPGYNADISAAALLMSYCNISLLIFSSVVMITLYGYFNRFLRKSNALPDARVASSTKNVNGFKVIFHAAS